MGTASPLFPDGRIPPLFILNQNDTPSRAHTSAKAAGVSQLLLLTRRSVTHIHTRGVFSGVCLGPHLSLSVTLYDPDYHENLVVFGGQCAAFPPNFMTIS